MIAAHRFGVVGLLLALLLPAIAALLALDSWNDYQAVTRIVQDAYDHALLEPVQALDDSVQWESDGQIRIDAAFSVEAMFEAIGPRPKYLHVGFSRGGTSTTLLGTSDLPAAPDAPDGQPVFYDAHYRSTPVRIAALRHTVTGPDGQPIRVLSQAAESTGPRLQAQAQSLRQALWSGLRLIAAMVLLVWAGVTWALRPLLRLRRSLHARGITDLQPLDSGHVPAEVVPLVEAVNHHIARHRELLENQSRFLADASHQLRTPLAIMLTQASFAVRQKDAQTMRESLEAILAQLARARRLSDQLLALAHAQHTAGEAPHTLADLNVLAREVVVQHLPLAHEKNLDLGWADARGAQAQEMSEEETGAPEKAPAAPVRANAAEVQEALSNLLHNAIAYTPANGRITVSVRCEGGEALAEVLDSGPGMPPALRAQAFERFRRGHAQGTPMRQGAGLGLAIAQAYAGRNGGRVVLSDGEDGQGLHASLCLPLAQEPAAASPHATVVNSKVVE